ncbi:MAG: hypothetical protein OXI92_13130, partial [Acidobacteriota bacterium]|nr:hypothetical protein [Acidobacteriota bacterium]
MAGIEGLQQVRGFATANLTHDDMIRSVAQRMSHQVPNRHGVLESTSLESETVAAFNSQLQHIFD